MITWSIIFGNMVDYDLYKTWSTMVTNSCKLNLVKLDFNVLTMVNHVLSFLETMVDDVLTIVFFDLIQPCLHIYYTGIWLEAFYLYHTH